MTRDEILEVIKKTCTSKNGQLKANTGSTDWWAKNGILHVLDEIVSLTSFLPSDASFRNRVHHIQNNDFTPMVCAMCNKHLRWHKPTSRYMTYCSSSCSSNGSKEKREATNIARYGSSNVFASSEIKTRAQVTTMEKYGVLNYAKSDEFSTRQKTYWDEMSDEDHRQILKKRKDTCLEKYGASSPFTSPVIIEKIKQSMLERHGVESPLQSVDILKKQQSTMIDRYGRANFQQRHLSEDSLGHINDPLWLADKLKTLSTREIMHELGVTHSTICKALNKFGLMDKKVSSFHKEIGTFIESMGVTVDWNSIGKLVGKTEVDLYIDELKLGIECNGVYWHSEISGKKHPKYHITKTEAAKDNGFRLIHVTDTEWFDDAKRDIISSKLMHLCKHTPTKIFGRKCMITEVTTDQERQFLEDNHLQGYAHSSVKYGLYYDGCLVMVMTFGKPRYNKNAEWELIRLATKKFHSVVGGASRLLTHFIKNHSPKNILSYCDRRWSDGEVYTSVGFELSHISPPSYQYWSNSVTELQNRTKFQKHKLCDKLEIFDETLTEWENMQNNGYDRIWDCGNLVYIWQANRS